MILYLYFWSSHLTFFYLSIDLNFIFFTASRAAKKSIIIGVVLVLVHEFCGVFAMLNYTATIFAESGSDISPGLSAIIVGFIQLVGTMVATQLIDRSGRKVQFAD